MARQSYFKPYLDRYLLKVTLFVEVTGQELVEDHLGNIAPSVTKIPFLCYLKETGAKDDLRQQRPGGLGVVQVYMKGYLVEPMIFPPSVVLPREFEAECDGKQGKFSSMLKRRLCPSVPSKSFMLLTALSKASLFFSDIWVVSADVCCASLFARTSPEDCFRSGPLGN